VKRFLLATFVLLSFCFASATMVKPMSVEELSTAATHIVEGQAQDTWTSWNATHTRIYTFTRVKVSRALKGSSASDTVVIKQVGGSAGGYTQHVAGVQPMQTGEQALLFLRPSQSADGTMVIVGLMQGHFRVARDSQSGQVVVSNGVMGAEEFSGNKVKAYRGNSLTLSQMEARIRKAVPRE
jgi:hypothetical protein